MDVTPIVAVYAALIASATAGIQFAELHTTRTRLKITANGGTAQIEGESEDSFGNKTLADDEVLFVHITNRSSHPIKISHVGAQLARRGADRGFFFARPYPLHLKLPIEIPARDSLTIWQPQSTLKDCDQERLRIVVQTAAGKDFESKPFVLDNLPRLVLH